MGKEKGKTNRVYLRNTAPEGGRLIIRPTHAKRDDGAHIAVPKKSSPGKCAWYDGDNRAIRIWALGNPNANPPVLPALAPANAEAKEWLKEVQAEAARIAEELAEQ